MELCAPSKTCAPHPAWLQPGLRVPSAHNWALCIMADCRGTSLAASVHPIYWVASCGRMLVRCRPRCGARQTRKLIQGFTMYAIRRHRAAVKAWCWRVRFSRRGVMYSRAFFDLVCGGPKEAKAQAVAWRDAQVANLKALTLVEFHERHRSNNVSGMPGVHFHKTARQPLGFWQAKIRFHDGKSRAKAFSVRLHGYEEAFCLAVAARTELLAQVENRPYLHHPVAKRLCRQR